MNSEILSLLSNIESLDEALDFWSTLKEKERQMNWLQGDFICTVVSKFGSSKEVYGKLAEVGWGGIKHLQQVEKVSRSFGDEERYPDVRWSIFRECYNASTRTGETPSEILRKALELSWSVKDIQRYGKELEPEFLLVEQCKVCGTKVSLVSKSEVEGIVNCPVCLMNGEETELGSMVRKE